MDAGVFEILGTRYYTHGFGLLFVAPFVLLFVISLIRILVRAADGKPVKWYGPVIFAICSLAMLVAVFWDVYQIGQQATKLCNEKAGLHVYRTAETEGILGLFSIEHWSKYGFKFVEYEDVLKKKTRYFYENGKSTQKTVDKFLSQYELVTTRSHIAPRIEIIKQEIKDISTNEVLGESNEFSIDGGWADMFFYRTTGFSYSPWICSGTREKRQIFISELIESTLNTNRKQQ